MVSIEEFALVSQNLEDRLLSHSEWNFSWQYLPISMVAQFNLRTLQANIGV